MGDAEMPVVDEQAGDGGQADTAESAPAAAAGAESSSDESDGGDKYNLPPDLKFRSYIPRDRHLRKRRMEERTDLPTAKSVMNEMTEFFQKELAEAEKSHTDIHSLLPKRMNWDLKRDVAKRLERLEKRTRKAMAEIMRQAQAEPTEQMES